MYKIKDCIDATEPYTVHITPKACRKAKSRDPNNCAGARAVRFNDPNVEDVKIFLTRSFIKFKDQPLPVRYENSKAMREIAELNDLKGEKGLVTAMRLTRIYGSSWDVLLLPVKPVAKLKHLRSEKFKAIRKASRIRRKGKSKRTYTKPEENGLRSGIGKAHTWKEASL